jgi:acyl carrier protein phosphodiesterase
MNYLAHLYLSGNSEELIIGNFIADSVKGSQINNYSKGIKQGILMHREIDSFTDSHPIVTQSKARLRNNYKKYSGIIVDIFYDHFLAIHWKNYSDKTLLSYTQEIYRLLHHQQHLFPEKAKLFYGYMITNNILNAYADFIGIAKVLSGMSRRSVFKSNMETATIELQEYYQSFEAEFQLFFPELKNYVLSRKTVT